MKPRSLTGTKSRLDGAGLLLIAGLFLVLFPPLHWLASGSYPIFGLPRSLFYLFGFSALLTAGLALAWLLDGTKA
ncbi:MAG TPA: hypothetical protein VKV77_04220 [Methylovirgula sp.]|nr:hypothetical protein [Methylovirgula sp.]